MTQSELDKLAYHVAECQHATGYLYHLANDDENEPIPHSALGSYTDDIAEHLNAIAPVLTHAGARFPEGEKGQGEAIDPYGLGSLMGGIDAREEMIELLSRVRALQGLAEEIDTMQGNTIGTVDGMRVGAGTNFAEDVEQLASKLGLAIYGPRKGRGVSGSVPGEGD